MSKSSNFRVRSMSWLSCLALLAVLVLLNTVFARSYVRADLTEEDKYTLHPASRKILGGLQDPCSIRVFWDSVPLVADGNQALPRGPA